MSLPKHTLCSTLLCLAIVSSACTMPTPTPTPVTPPPPALFVSTGGSDSNDCLGTATACLTLHGAYTKSVPGSTINIGPGTFNETYTVPEIYHDLIVQGAGRDLTVISSSVNNVVVHVVRPVNVTFRGVTIDHAATGPLQIGVDMAAASNVTLQDCRVRNNAHDGVRNYGNLLTIQNCIIENNETGVENHGTLAMTGSSINNNISGLASNSGSAQVDNTTFDGNGEFDAASGSGSTAITNRADTTLTLRRVSVSHSRAFAIVLEGGTTDLEGVTVQNNAGMGIWAQQGTLTMISSILLNNAGYGLEVGGLSGVVDGGTVNISQSAIIGNHSAGLRIDGGEIHVQNTTISGNFASSVGGGGIWGYGGNLFLLDSTVAYNVGDGLQIGSDGTTGDVITIRRSVIALNSGDECQVDARLTLSTAASPYVCSESWTPATLKLNALVLDAGTYVHPISADSPLVDGGGVLAFCPGVDQRGYHRPGGATCDAGAYERGGTPILLPAPLVIIATAGIRPTDTAAPPPTPTPSPAPVHLSLAKNANCRHGPGAVYPVLTSVLKGQQIQLIGRNDDGSWLFGSIPGGFQCWIASSAGTPDGNPQGLPVLVAPPTPTPTVTPKPDKGGATDFDKDGFPADKDCNDKNAKIHPGAGETAKDGVDSNCNGDDDT